MCSVFLYVYLDTGTDTKVHISQDSNITISTDISCKNHKVWFLQLYYVETGSDPYSATSDALLWKVRHNG